MVTRERHKTLRWVFLLSLLFQCYSASLRIPFQERIRSADALRIDGLRAVEYWAEEEEGNFTVILQRNLTDWCNIDAKDLQGRSFYTQFVDGLVSALNASSTHVRVLSICTYDGSLCLFQEASCPPDIRNISLEYTDERGAEELDIHGVSAVSPGITSRMQVVFSVPLAAVEVLTDFFLSDMDAVVRLRMILVEMAPANTNATSCSERENEDPMPGVRIQVQKERESDTHTRAHTSTLSLFLSLSLSLSLTHTPRFAAQRQICLLCVQQAFGAACAAIQRNCVCRCVKLKSDALAHNGDLRWLCPSTSSSASSQS